MEGLRELDPVSARYRLTNSAGKRATAFRRGGGGKNQGEVKIGQR